MNLEQDKLVLSVDSDGDFDEIDIKNETLNEAVIANGIIEIAAEHIKNNEYGDMTITLYKLSKIAAL